MKNEVQSISVLDGSAVEKGSALLTPSPAQPLMPRASPKVKSKVIRAKKSPASPKQPRKAAVKPKSPKQPRKAAVKPKSPRQPRKAAVKPKSPRQPRKAAVKPKSPRQPRKAAVKPRKSPASPRQLRKFETNNRAPAPMDLRSQIDVLYRRRFGELLEEIRMHEPTKGCSGSLYKTGLWFAWLLTHGKLPQKTCIPTFRFTDNYVRHSFEEVALHNGYTTKDQVKKFMAAQQSGNLLILVKPSHTVEMHPKQKWTISGLYVANAKTAFARCATDDIVVISLVMVPGPGLVGHNNALIINNRLRTYERFEPNGRMPMTENLDRYLDSKAFRALLPDPTYKYVPSTEVCINLGPQALARMPASCKNGGFCVTFSTMWLHLRMLMPLWTARDVHNLWLTLSNEELLYYMVRYQGWIDEELGENAVRHRREVVDRLKLDALVSPSVVPTRMH